ncbi:hypothetical protein M407DRAFT_67722 [Tulasnella calospora MUT 4182]|uniref:Choline/carnitine acyltransferase domain-containing protein n=1 Tax=Tulasnella calospora MUT 4182 TaxID=1051891 RepID=A0A0C3LCF8_9AGAM|nr:hypothetical protein M407DRAFT_67722 [Tulasnella calospora MUT 4182]
MFALHPPRKAERLPTFHHQRSLPRLPVPPLRASLDRYLKSLEPVLEQNEEQGGEAKDAALRARQEWAQEFENGIGKALQQRLIDLDRASPNNWLNDNFWLKKAYHEWRAPLPVNSNWWLLFHDDPNVPEDLRRSIPSDGEITEWQVRRAAWLVRRLVDFKEKLDRQEIHPDSSRTGPFCMYQYTRLFNMCRLPGYGCDSNTEPPKASSPNARKIVVFVKDWVYSVEVIERDGTPVPPAGIERRLAEVVEDVRQREARGEKPARVNILSADERDLWAKNREYLLTLSPTNRSTTTVIEESLFALSLDAHTLPPHDQPSSAPTSSTTKLTRPDVDAQVQNTAFGGPSGLNRWFDKALSLMVESNGRGGMMGEHSPCDALIPSIIVDYSIAEHMDTAQFGEHNNLELGSTKAWDKLEWVVDEKVEAEIARAQKDAKKMLADSEPSQLWFGEYGAEWMKNVAKCSPDAYIQMAVQLAWYKDQGSMTATYETASTRLFAHGRTEVIRTLSADSRKWVKAMCDPSASVTTRKTLLLDAIAAHNAYTRDASTGKGCDRHLAGLRWMYRPDMDGPTPKLFEDPMFSKSSEWKLSTSGLSAGTRFNGTGFGTVWPDGYGINYLAGPQLVKFGIESKVSCPTTSTYRFKARVVESLQAMRELFELAGEEPRSKL